MIYGLAAGLAALAHLTFIAFIVFGAIWGRRSKPWRTLHIGCMIYGVGIEVFQWICPLTYVEKYFRDRAGAGVYEESFLIHYINRLIYIELPQWLLIVAAVAVLLANGWLYSRWSRRSARVAPRQDAGPDAGHDAGQDAPAGG